MTNEEIAQKWVEGLTVIRSHLAVINDDAAWQQEPNRVLAATDRLAKLKSWCLEVMAAWPEMREKFLEDIARREEADGRDRPSALQDAESAVFRFDKTAEPEDRKQHPEVDSGLVRHQGRPLRTA
ncbi:hypothetical protein [Geothermobacter ehrlichii]|uniref:hypothetical protein n=1 Tax=Geothermobacter ehrlichii TaxID=213224 RepID=UPI001FE52A7A|nr:hypothetical protein [Geothermobacter ehrlichii]